MERTRGADEKTPSRSEYFSWINSTNEGSTEKQTLINLAFFRYLYEQFGMKLDIYAWDAGNLDGACGGYERADSEKLKAQYPKGYRPVVEYAGEMGTRMGVWGGADGYGDTEEEAKARRELLVGLCRDYHWALFKFDAVCGGLRKEKQEEFDKTLCECRKYSPDLILLNHRNDLGEAEAHATTFLWEGLETYTDVHGYNTVTAPHNRACIFFRGHTPGLKRLTEDHGVCLSSSLDFFEDDLVYQAFNRSLILAPEIYGNPWLLRDDELPLLARIYNLHRRHREILVNGFLPKDDLGNNAVWRGDGNRRFLATGNARWEKRTVEIELDETVGLASCERVCVTRRFPTEQYLGTYAYGDRVKIELPAFRAVLLEVCNASVADEQLTNCEYAVLHETDGKIDLVNLLAVWGRVERYDPASGKSVPLAGPDFFDIRMREPVRLGSLKSVSVPPNAEELYESAVFPLDNDSLEMRSLRRSGKSEIPAVLAARDAFFSQPSYRLRGPDGQIPFDGDPQTIYDTKSRSYLAHEKGCRVEGGCLRADFGGVLIADRIEIEYFDAEGKEPETFAPQTVRDNAEISAELSRWQRAPLQGVETSGTQKQKYFAYYSDILTTIDGARKKAVYKAEIPFRYLRIPDPVDRIYSIKLFRDGKEIQPPAPRLNNLFAPYEKKKTRAAAKAKFRLESLPAYPYLAVACEGKTGSENVVCCAEINGKTLAFPSRAPAYPANPYEYPVHPVDGNYTFYLPLDADMAGREIKITVLFAGEEVPVNVYLCDGHGKREGKRLSLKGRENGKEV